MIVGHGATGWAAVLAAALLMTPTADAEDPLYYVVDGDAIVFTNQRGSETRVVPGFAGRPADRKAEPRRSSSPAPSADSRVTLPATVFDPYIERVAHENGLAPELVKAVALVESGFDARAVSRKGAQGLMQLMPATAREYGVEDAFDPLANLRGGATHLRRLLDRFDGDLTLALAAYNAGEAAVRRHAGVPNYPETVDYVRKVHARLGKDPLGMPSTGRRTPSAKAVRFRTLEDGTVLLSND